MFAWDGPRTIQLSTESFSRRVIPAWTYALADHGKIGRRLLWLVRNPPVLPDPLTGVDWRWVYFARRPSDGVGKVGITRAPSIRVEQLRWPVDGGKAASGFDLVAVMPFCESQHEAALKTWLRPWSLQGSTEYLRDAPEVRLFFWCLRAAHDPLQAQREKARLGSALNSIGTFFRECGIRSGVLPHDGRYRCAICRSPRHTRRKCPDRFAAMQGAA